MRRYWLVVFAILAATLLGGCPVFTRGDGSSSERPSLVDPADDGHGHDHDE